MAKSIPTDVIRGMRGKISDMRSRSDQFKIDSDEARVKADLLHTEALLLEMMVDQWKDLFPETVE